MGLLTAQQKEVVNKQSPKTTAANLDRMTAAGKSQREMAQYVFDNHGCNGCHNAQENGRLGFTARGMQLAGGFEGCIRTLASMNFIAMVPVNQRSAEQRKKAQQFEDFGCTLCHQIVPGKMGLTELAAKLKIMHRGCNDIQELLAAWEEAHEKGPTAEPVSAE